MRYPDVVNIFTRRKVGRKLNNKNPVTTGFPANINNILRPSRRLRTKRHDNFWHFRHSHSHSHNHNVTNIYWQTNYCSSAMDTIFKSMSQTWLKTVLGEIIERRLVFGEAISIQSEPRAKCKTVFANWCT